MIGMSRTCLSFQTFTSNKTFSFEVGTGKYFEMFRKYFKVCHIIKFASIAVSSFNEI